MSDPSGGNFPPGGGGKGSNVPPDGSSGTTPTVTEQSTERESLPDPDDWGSASEPPIPGIPVKTPAAYAPTEMLPVRPEQPPAQPPAAAPQAAAAPQVSPVPGLTVPDGPTIVPSGDAQPPAAPEPMGSGTAPFAIAPYATHVPGMPYAPPAPAAPYASPGALPPVQAAPRAAAAINRQLIMLAGVLGGLFLLLGIVVGIVALARSNSTDETPVAAIPSAAPVEEPAAPPPEPTPIAPPVTVAPAAARPAAPKAKKDAGAAPASSSSAKPAGSTSPPPSTSSSTSTPGGAIGADAGRRGRKVAH